MKNKVLLLLFITVLLFSSCNTNVLLIRPASSEISGLDLESNPENSESDEFYSNLTAVFRTYINETDITPAMSDEKLQNIAKKILFDDGETIFDKGVFLRYNNYNGNGIVYGNKGNYVGSEYGINSGTATGSDYLCISSKDTNFTIPLEIKIGDSLKSVIDKLNATDKYINNDINFENYNYAPVSLYKNETNTESLSYYYHTHYNYPTDTTIETGHVTIQYNLTNKININGSDATRSKSIRFKFIDGVLENFKINCSESFQTNDIYNYNKTQIYKFENRDYQYDESNGLYIKFVELKVDGGSYILKYKAYSDNPISVEERIEAWESPDNCPVYDIKEIEYTTKEKIYEVKYSINSQHKLAIRIGNIGFSGFITQNNINFDYLTNF